MIFRYSIFNSNQIPSFFLSKFNFLAKRPINFSKLIVQLGLFKIYSMFIQHTLLLMELIGGLAVIKHQLHGKRKRQTSSSAVSLYRDSILCFLDRYLNEYIWLMKDFKTPKYRKIKNSQLVYDISMRVREKLTGFTFSDLVEPIMLDTHRGIFLPLSLHFKFENKISYTSVESYLRAFRLPLSFFKRHKRPAFDDKISFSRIT